MEEANAIFKYGNTTKAPSINVMRKIKADMNSQSIWRQSDEFAALNCLSSLLKFERTGHQINGYLQTFSIEPLCLTLYSEEMLRCAGSFKETPNFLPVWHIDATGSVVKDRGDRKVYLYSIVAPCPIKGEPSAPVLEFLTDCHNTVNLSSIFFRWKLSVRNILPLAEVVVTDFSWAIMHSVCEGLFSTTLNEQLEAQWQKCLDVNHQFQVCAIVAAILSKLQQVD